MNEVQAIAEALAAANNRGERCALATVASAEGSSYRRPGARMLATGSGTSTGTISAGYGVHGIAPSIGRAGFLSGRAFATSGFISSDRRLERDIRPIGNPLETIDRLRPRTYFFRLRGELRFSLPREMRVRRPTRSRVTLPTRRHSSGARFGGAFPHR